ncbi:MAG: Tricarboxylate transport protein TctC [Betaproteobacteria bacterium]|nr:Tricarboxylate transport protein TctC [Betaproteobacteria bacterium]
MMHRRTFAAGLATAAVLLAAAPTLAQAQAYPSRPIRLIVPFAAGGTTDIVARIVGDKLGRELGQPVIIENRGGGGGMIGADALAKSAPDGYILGVATVSTLATIPATTLKMPYDAGKDFSMIINLVNVPNVMTINPKVPAQNMKEFIALLKKNPGKFSYASSGTGGISHLDGELFKVLTGTYMVHIPYKGSGPALTDTVAGQVEVEMDNLPSSLPFIKAGKLRALGMMSDKRVDTLPDVPTFAELGLKEANNMAWYGLVGPAGLPKDIVAKVNAAANATLKDADVKRHLAEGGSTPDGGTPEHFVQVAARELALRRDIVKKQNIKME